MTVEVHDGNIEDALASLKTRVNREGIIREYKAARTFVPQSERNLWARRRRQQRARKQAEREARRAEW